MAATSIEGKGEGEESTLITRKTFSIKKSVVKSNNVVYFLY